MIVVKKMKDDNWLNTFYLAKATKLEKQVTGKTRIMALMNLKKRIRDFKEV